MSYSRARICPVCPRCQVSESYIARGVSRKLRVYAKVYLRDYDCVVVDFRV